MRINESAGHKYNLTDHLGNDRVYDPILGMFNSPDPFIQSPMSTQNYNRYTYVLNNPLKYIDPSGYSMGPIEFLTAIIYFLYHTDYGGTFSHDEGLNTFGSNSDAMDAASSYNNMHSSWGNTSYGAGGGIIPGAIYSLTKKWNKKKAKVSKKYKYVNGSGFLYWCPTVNWMLTRESSLFDMESAQLGGVEKEVPLIKGPRYPDFYSSSSLVNLKMWAYEVDFALKGKDGKLPPIAKPIFGVFPVTSIMFNANTIFTGYDIINETNRYGIDRYVIPVISIVVPGAGLEKQLGWEIFKLLPLPWNND